jgi:hypothetical protein
VDTEYLVYRVEYKYKIAYMVLTATEAASPYQPGKRMGVIRATSKGGAAAKLTDTIDAAVNKILLR